MSADQPGLPGVDPATLRQISRFGQQAAHLREIIQQAQRQAPAGASGEDASGSVRVTLAHDGLPSQIRIERQWRSRLTPAELGAAVREAAAAAAQARLAAWSQALEAGGLRARMQRVMRDDNPSLATPVSEIPAMFRAAPGDGGLPPRRLDETAEDVISSLGRAAPPPPTVQAVGRAVRGRVTVTLTAGAGLTGCTIDAAWAHAARPADLDQALQTALAEARSTLRTQSAAPSTSTAADALFTEVLGFLHHPDRLT